MYDLVEESKKMDFDGRSYYFSYKVSSINRAEREKYGIQLRILFEGKEEEPKVDVIAKGVGIRTFDKNNSPYHKRLNNEILLKSIGFIVIFIIVLTILTVLILSPIVSVLTRKADITSRRKYARELFLAVKSENLQPNKTDEEIADLIADMLYKRQCDLWSRKSLLSKWTMGLISPERSDHRIVL